MIELALVSVVAVENALLVQLVVVGAGVNPVPESVTVSPLSQVPVMVLPPALCIPVGEEMVTTGTIRSMVTEDALVVADALVVPPALVAEILKVIAPSLTGMFEVTVRVAVQTTGPEPEHDGVTVCPPKVIV